MSAMWKLEKDLCRCCHAEGSFKHLSDPCFLLGQEEIYSVMLQDCLDIKIVPMTGPLCDATYTICESCVARLRDASNFKRQVQDCEERFKEMYSKNMIKGFAVKDEPCESDADMKQEFQSVEEDEDDDDAFMKFDDEGDDASSYEEHEEMISVEIEAESSAKGKGKAKAKPKPKPKKAPVKKTKSKEKPIKVETEELTEAAVSGEKKKGKAHIDEFVTEVPDLSTEKQHMCKACKVSYRRLSDLRNHISRTHLKQKFIKCSLCSETFMYHTQRKNHMYSVHAVEKPEKFLCGHCGREFKRKNTLAEHMMDVHIERNCSHCELKFVRKKILFHLNEAHGVPMPTCGICGLRSVKESALIRHQRNVHLNEKNIVCKICKRRFFTRSNLHDHMITHNQERVFKCDVCAKTFARKECYRTHYRIHTGEKPYNCEVCGAAFVQRAGLRFHAKSHHRDK
ncbi:zinc finger protein 852-like isoform X9 [Cydia pomonella]|uniref:zinc finger protein 852-like isoform X9 n=1 Tax=Cydia pomonella TaxID=82600 RepID=UPI002ADE1DAB|nr:zinc finger protein 852-like isoform X9 [Cydia pomonella]